METHATVSFDEIKFCLSATTWKSYASAWRRFVDFGAALRPAFDIDGSLALAWLKQLCSTNTRPQGAFGTFSAVLSLVAECQDLPSPLENKIIGRAKASLLRNKTTRDRDAGPILDVYKVLEYVKTKSKAKAALDDSRTNRRDLALAAFAATIPSRPGEFAALTLSNVTHVVAEPRLGVANHRCALHQWPAARRAPVVGEPQPAFHLEVLVSQSKMDKTNRFGIRKILQHPAGSSWSPALLLLSHALSLPRNAEQPLFPNALTGGHLSVAALSKALGRVALAATGTRVPGKWYRHAAATWLLANGMDVETVAALGGWKTTEALRRHYTRATPCSDAMARRIAGLPPLPEDLLPGAAGAANPFAARPPLMDAAALQRALRASGYVEEADDEESSDDSDFDDDFDDLDGATDAGLQSALHLLRSKRSTPPPSTAPSASSPAAPSAAAPAVPVTATPRAPPAPAASTPPAPAASTPPAPTTPTPRAPPSSYRVARALGRATLGPAPRPLVFATPPAPASTRPTEPNTPPRRVSARLVGRKEKQEQLVPAPAPARARLVREAAQPAPAVARPPGARPAALLRGSRRSEF